MTEAQDPCLFHWWLQVPSAGLALLAGEGTSGAVGGWQTSCTLAQWSILSPKPDSPDPKQEDFQL